MHDVLEAEVLIEPKISGDRFTMGLWCDQHVAIDDGVLGEEGDCVCVLVEHLVLEPRAACNQFADEAPAGKLLVER
jgi:hypothetical protein